MSEVDPADDLPASDPRVRSDYEAALGRFLVAFNEIENGISTILELALLAADRKDLVAPLVRQQLVRRLEYLELISLRFPQASSPDLVPAIRALAGERNALAHGHFDQNPVDDSFEIVGQGKARQIPLNKLDELAAVARQLAQRVRNCEGQMYFAIFPFTQSD